MGGSLGRLNFWIRVNTKLGLPCSFFTRSVPLDAMNCEALVLPSRPQFSKVSLICRFSSSRSVSTTMVGEPANLRRIFCARKTIE